MWHTFPPSKLLMIMYKSVDGWPDGSLYSLLLWQLMHSLPKSLLWNISDSIWDYLTASVCVAMKQRLIHLSQASINAFMSWHFKWKEEQLCFPELTVSTTTFNSSPWVQISLLCLETLCTMSDEWSPEMYERKHQNKWQWNIWKSNLFSGVRLIAPNTDFRNLSEAESTLFWWENSREWITEALNYSILQTGVIVSLLVVKK